jgi:hypothetical protein
VELGPLLGRVRSIDDLVPLLAALGHEPLHDTIPLPGGGSAVAVARAGEFVWLAVLGNEPERLVRRLARRSAARGRVAGFLALDPGSRRLALAVAFDGAPSLELKLDRPHTRDLAALGRLSAAGSAGTLSYAARAAEALSGQAVGRRFFREFKTTLDRMAEGLPSRARGEERRSLALLQLTRVLFLYFIQSKGWLAGRERFLADEVDRCLSRKRRIHRDLLRPLFFGTLNRPPAERSRMAAGFGAVPFLNGGLFEPHPLERSLRGDIPNDLWRDAFDRLFERFHFTAAEDRGTGIGPDMLGRVFEGVMAPDVRRASGTFYTPAALVRSVLDAALGAAVAARLDCGEDEAQRRLGERDPVACGALDALTILDPAAGSGAFLLGALERLSSYAAGDGLSLAAARRRILQRNLFGVDRSAAAVRLTELRLWLAVVADDPETRPERVEPLPNLDCLIRQGDSLFEPGGAAPLHAPDARLAQQVSRVRSELVTATGADKRRLVRELRLAESRAAHDALESAEAHVRNEIAEALHQARSLDLFGHRRGMDRELRVRLASQRTELRALRAARRTLAREREVPWFQYRSQFADVFAAGGFSLVVGNPPWLRAEDIPAELRRRLEGRYRWWRGARGAFGNRPDLAIAFLERALELTARDGIVALLVPSKLATAGYGVTARHGLAAGTTLLRLAELTGLAEARFDATVYPLALVAKKASPPAGHRVRTGLGHAGGAIPQARLAGGGPWLLSAGRAATVADRLAKDHPTVGARFTCHLGVKTGANRIFLGPPPDVEPELLRWAVRGRDVRPFGVRDGVRILWTHGASGAPLERLPPAAAAYLEPHHELLRARTDFDRGPPWMLFRTAAASAAHRVIWPDLARRLTAVALTGRCGAPRIPLNTCYVAPAGSRDEADRLAAWLNSRWTRALARLGAVPAASGFHRFSAGVIARLPLPESALADEELSILAQEGRRGEEIQEALDDAVARHLGLTPRDRAALGAADRR